MDKLRRVPFFIAIGLAVLAVAVEFVGACIGMGLAALGLFDLFLLLTVLLISAPLLIGNNPVGRVQGVVTFVLAIVILLMALVLLMMAVVLLYVMLSSLIFIPFYLAAFASFPKSEAAVFIGLAMTLKLGFAFFLVIAHQRFLENFGLVILVAMSLGLTILLAFLHGFPTVFVSITDDIAAIIILIVTALRAIGFAIAALPAMKKAVGL